MVLVLVLLASSVVFGASGSYYGKTYVYFNIPSIISFNITLPNNEQYASSESGTPTADEEFNTTGSDANVTIYVKGTSYRQNSTVIGDTTNVSNYKINNTGNSNLNITLCINASLPSTMVLFGTKTADPYNSPQIIPNCSYSAWIANASLSPNVMDEIWLWTNFTSAAASVVRELYINSTES